MAKRIIVTDSIDKDLLKFILNRHVLTLATSLNNQPYCSSCFYTYYKKDSVFIFTSENETRHIHEGTKNEKVAGTIYLDTRIIGKIRGVQFTGTLHRAENEFLQKYKSLYLKRFPYAAAGLADIWYIKPDYIKFTDNRLGFGTKMVWQHNKDL